MLEGGRDCVQLLFNQLCRLPTARNDEGDVLAQLPPPTTPIPREKHVCVLASLINIVCVRAERERERESRERMYGELA